MAKLPALMNIWARLENYGVNAWGVWMGFDVWWLDIPILHIYLSGSGGFGRWPFLFSM